MAEVWEAFDERLRRPVAVKLMASRGLDPVARQRFVREARSTARFSHPNAVTLFDAGEADGELFLVMELVRGTTLTERIAAGPLEPAEAARIAAATLDALDAAHAAGIVH